MRPPVRLFVILWLAGFAGVLSILLIDLDALLRILPVAAGTRLPMSASVVKLLGLIQPAMLLTMAVAIGMGLASKVGLSAPGAEAAAHGRSVMAAMRPQWVPGVLGGIAGGALIVLVSAATRPFLAPAVVARISEFGRITPLPMRFLYGGITEELLLRWGFMTLLVWAAWRWFQRGQGHPKAAYFVGAILIPAILFGIGHLPIAFLLIPAPTFALIVFVIVANSVFGIIAGFLYWKRGLEAAIVAHIVAHVVMLAATKAGAYF